MTNEEAIAIIRKEYLCVDRDCDIDRSCGKCDLMMPTKEPILEAYNMAIKALEQEPKPGHCKDCKWWKDSDGLYRRGTHAESQCPINRREVFEGNGYCYMFESQESEG